MKTLITGATGFIGRRLTGQLASLGRELRCAVRPMSDTTALLNRPSIEVVCADFQDKASLENLVRGVDVVYHLAVDYSRPTIEDVRNLLDVCLSKDIKRFVYFSSIAAVGLSNVQEVITEKTSCHPDTEYGKLKRTAEQILLEAHAKHRLPVVIVRPTSVYGIGETNFWLPLFQAIYGGRLTRLFGDGSNLLSLCFVDNLIQGVLLAEQSEAALGQVYIMSDESPYPFRNVANAIAVACDASPPVSAIPKHFALPVAQVLEYSWRLQLTEPVVPFLPGNVSRWMAHYPCSVAKARAELGFSPTVGLTEGILRTAEWYRENGHLSHSVPWTDGVLDTEELPQPSRAWKARAARAGGRAIQLAWNVAALGWRLPPKLARRIRRHTGHTQA
jgi:nucleoside-diphosphate-sugar epimerase